MAVRNNSIASGRSDAGRAPLAEQLGRAFDAVAGLISNIRADQWSAPTPCPDWTVRQVVNHLIGMNRVFAALLAGQPPPPRPSANHVEDDPVGAYRGSAAALLAAFGLPESSNAPTTGRSGPPPAPSDCRSGSTISSPMAGTSRRPPSSPPTCLRIWPNSRWRSPEPS